MAAVIWHPIDRNACNLRRSSSINVLTVSTTIAKPVHRGMGRGDGKEVSSGLRGLLAVGPDSLFLWGLGQLYPA